MMSAEIDIDLLCALLDPDSVHTIHSLSSLLIDVYSAQATRLELPNLVARLRRPGDDVVGDDVSPAKTVKAMLTAFQDSKHLRPDRRNESINASMLAESGVQPVGISRRPEERSRHQTRHIGWTASRELYHFAQEKRNLSNDNEHVVSPRASLALQILCCGLLTTSHIFPEGKRKKKRFHSQRAVTLSKCTCLSRCGKSQII